MSEYRRFLEDKIKLAPSSGFEVADSEINPLLKPHQRAIVRWALRGGRRAIFAAFGLGKTPIQIEIMRLIVRHERGDHEGYVMALIIAPLGVRREFMATARLLATGEGDGVDEDQRRALAAWLAEEPSRAPVISFIRSNDEAAGDGLYMTNYETVRDGKLDPNAFIAATLDEASILRSYGSKTFQTFLSLFDRVRYRFVATATPNPNRHKELIHYAGFLGVMDTGQALTRWFQRNSERAGDLTLYPHKEDEFWLWMASWAVVLEKPSDLGFDDTGYDLPPLRIVEHVIGDRIAPTVGRDGMVDLLPSSTVSVQDTARVKRNSLEERVACAADILRQDPESHYVIWHDLEDERRAIERAVPGVVSVFGAQELELREQHIGDFSDGLIRHLSTKPVLAGSGCNFQRHCHKAVFTGIGHKFNDFIQAVHRLQRFLQRHDVEIHVIYTEAEHRTWRGLLAKWEQYREMVRRMVEIVKSHGLDSPAMAGLLSRSIGVERIEAAGDGWTAVNADCVEETARMAENSVDLIVTSIPFGNHYEYSASYNDFGHTDDDDHFFAQLDHLTPNLLRVLKPGRIAAVHVKDRILFGSVTGYGRPTVSPFHARTIFHMTGHGFLYLGIITVVTDVVRENNQTYRLGYSEMCKDGSRMGVGSPEYVLLMAKPHSDLTRGYADTPVTRDKAGYSLARWQIDAHAFWRSSGNRLPTAAELAMLGPDRLAKLFTAWSLEGVYDYETHVRIGEALEARGALPSSFMALAPGSHDPDVWHDVNRMLTLNSTQSRKKLEAHICPLQFDIVDRLIERYSMPGELVFDPFGGLMTVPYRALPLGRKGHAVELNARSFLDGVKHLEAMSRKSSAVSLFDMIDLEAGGGEAGDGEAAGGQIEKPQAVAS
ncbi:DNA methyltransferase [Oceanibaculum indicum]|uniref:site-specific DNA-methyltransferase (adenine-specific) n=1 Tax=Oceanibaculum indicum TaxID=526216 RepID=A0A420WGL6_9PROT|nr:DNA methyltransferase [Oceanibaculum indicum]RKQ70140.1 DNA methylase [Oceanibaculum indicum]